MAACACLGPQNGAPLCPCRMLEAQAWIERCQSSRVLPGDPRLDTIIGGPLAGWRPIETAKRDGRHILACDASQSFGWLDGKPLPPVQTTVHWYEHGEDSGWYTSVNEIEPQRPFPATHWKPLDAPQDALTEQKE